MSDITYRDYLEPIALEDARILLCKDAEYGSSWKKRGGVGAFMMLARKWDRIEKQVDGWGHDLVKALERDTRDEGLGDDIGDLRRYLLLVLCELRARSQAALHGMAVDPMHYRSLLEGRAGSEGRRIAVSATDRWKRRGGLGVYMQLAYLWDDMEDVCRANGWDVLVAEMEPEVQELYQHLLLIGAEMRERIAPQLEAPTVTPGQSEIARTVYESLLDGTGHDDHF